MKKRQSVEAPAKCAATDWELLLSLRDEDIRSAVAADTEVRATDVAFWKNAAVMFPRIGPRR